MFNVCYLNNKQVNWKHSAYYHIYYTLLSVSYFLNIFLHHFSSIHTLSVLIGQVSIAVVSDKVDLERILAWTRNVKTSIKIKFSRQRYFTIRTGPFEMYSRGVSHVFQAIFILSHADRSWRGDTWFYSKLLFRRRRRRLAPSNYNGTAAAIAIHLNKLKLKTYLTYSKV